MVFYSCSRQRTVALSQDATHTGLATGPCGIVGDGTIVLAICQRCAVGLRDGSDKSSDINARVSGGGHDGSVVVDASHVRPLYHTSNKTEEAGIGVSA